MENNNKSFKKGIILGISVTLLVVLVLFSAGTWGGLFTINGGSLMKNNVSSEESKENEDDFEKKVQSKVHSVMRIIDAYYLEEYDEDEMLDGLLKGMLAAVGDPYTGYYDKESYSSLMESSQGVYYGIGVVVSQNIETGEVYVVNPYEDCPGFEAGIRPGDIIYSVGDVEVTGMDLNEVVALIRGAEGTTVDISVIHEGADVLSDLVVERRQIETHTVEYEVMENNIGYIQISEFDTITTEQFKNAMKELESCGIKGLIVDLRDNPGGSLDTVVDVLDEFLPKGIYTYLVDKNGNRQNYKGAHAATYDYPMVVLVNENSASASELFTGAVHDYERATVVGTTTFGKGIVQQIFPLRDGSGVKVTMAKYYTPNGVCIHKTGIEPDVVVELDEGEYPSTVEYEDDEQLQKAVEILTEQMNQ
ncbi:MAG: S41 family peptidase [Thermoflexaceae bacterium]|nr:S41 family peptidase [Thermoflexaceae bacterium]